LTIFTQPEKALPVPESPPQGIESPGISRVCPEREVIVHHHEIAIKGKNKFLFLDRLVANLGLATKGTGVREVKRRMGVVSLVLGPEADERCVAERVRRVFGIANFSVCFSSPLDLQLLQEAIGERLAGMSFGSFRILTRRSYKGFPMTSVDLDRAVGGFVKEKTGARVDLTHPDLTISIQIQPKHAFFSFEKIAGPGGIPVGVSGEVLCLLSGGIDSPVAAYRMMKRGCRVSFVHFHGQPYLSLASLEKARELASLLTRYQNFSTLYAVRFGDVQKEVVLAVPKALRVVLYRRLMLRIASQLASRREILALVTGESLGQVSSQTLDNITVIEPASTLPVFRPLIGMDKEEIIAQARAIGTFETSIEPDQDCCQLFIPDHPATRAKAAEVLRAEEKLPIQELVSLALSQTEEERFSFPPQQL
jgi:thiamine biosynthesis protein ThiI